MLPDIPNLEQIDHFSQVLIRQSVLATTKSNAGQGWKGLQSNRKGQVMKKKSWNY